MKIFRMLSMAGAVVVMLGIAGCGQKRQMQRPPMPVVSAKVVISDVPLYIDSIGFCVGRESVSIVPQVTGQIVCVNFKQGQAVKAGDVLYVIDPRAYEANFKRAKAQLKAATVKENIDKAQLERSRAMVANSYISDQQFESYEAQVDQDLCSIEAAEAQVAQAMVDLERCSITSPIDGIAGAYLVDIGNVVTAMSKPLVTIEAVDNLYVEFSISENDFHDLQRCLAEGGGKLETKIFPISSDGISGKAEVNFINNTIDRKTGSLKLRALMANPDNKFWPGQSVRVKVLLKTLKDAVLVPSDAVSLGQRGRYVFVIKDDKSVEMRLVEIGQVHGEMLVVTNGLKGSEVVVRKKQMMLAPNMKVVEVPDTQIGVFKKNMEHNRKIAEKNPTTN
jgi:multidrug efflux system membrane fusion protein